MRRRGSIGPLILVSLALASCDGEGDAGGETTPEPAGEEVTFDGRTASIDLSFNLAFEGIVDVTLTDVLDPVPPPKGFPSAVANDRLYGIELEFDNRGPDIFFYDLDDPLVALETSADRRAKRVFLVGGKCVLPSVRGALAPGQTFTACIAFGLPKGARPTTLTYDFGGDTGLMWDLSGTPKAGG